MAEENDLLDGSDVLHMRELHAYIKCILEKSPGSHEKHLKQAKAWADEVGSSSMLLQVVGTALWTYMVGKMGNIVSEATVRQPEKAAIEASRDIINQVAQAERGDRFQALVGVSRLRLQPFQVRSMPHLALAGDTWPRSRNPYPNNKGETSSIPSQGETNRAHRSAVLPTKASNHPRPRGGWNPGSPALPPGNSLSTVQGIQIPIAGHSYIPHKAKIKDR